MNTTSRAFTLLTVLTCGAAFAAPLSMSTKVDEAPSTNPQNVPSAGARDAVAATAAGNLSCPGFVNTRVIDLSWSNPRRMYTRDTGGFGIRDVLVIRFTTGAKSSDGRLPRISAGEYGSAPNWRFATLSSKPCDFEPQTKPGATVTGNSVTAIFALGNDPGVEFYPVLQTNRTYYLNIRNSADSNCAANGVCDMYVDLIKAGGL